MKLDELVPESGSNESQVSAPVVIRIRELRRSRALTQEELAEAVGLSRQSINAMEAGRCLPSLPVALQMASFFSVPVQTIFGFHALPEPQSSNNQIPNERKESAMAQLMPWSPLRDMREMLDEMMDDATAWNSPVAVTAPAVNISQTPNMVLVEVRVPGYKKEDINLELGDGYLTVSGEMKRDGEEKTEESRHYFRREFMQQSFSRTVSLPAPVQAENASAEMKHGVLHIALPKQMEEKPKTTKLEIKAE